MSLNQTGVPYNTAKAPDLQDIPIMAGCDHNGMLWQEQALKTCGTTEKLTPVLTRMGNQYHTTWVKGVPISYNSDFQIHVNRPPPAPPADQGGGGPTCPPRGPRHPGGNATTVASAATPRVPPVDRPLTPAISAAGRQPCAGTLGRPVGRGGTAAPGNAVWRAGHRWSDPPVCLPGEGGRTDHVQAP